MIKVKFRTHDATKYLRLTLEGHAGAGEKGQDLVCASASILAYTVAQCVKEMEERGELRGTPHIQMNGGDASIIFRCKDDKSYAEARHLFLVVKTGYELLRHNYPQCVDIKSVGQA